LLSKLIYEGDRKLYAIYASILLSMCEVGINYGFTSLNEDVSKEKSSLKEGYKVGQTAPDMELVSINGKTMKLSDLRGKIVLVDFWASWCHPCRKANPHVVEAYKKYKDKTFKNGKGFTVWGISLDRDKNAWIAAVKADKLVWDTNFLGNRDVAGKYGVRSIPSQFLIDGDGVILASYVGYDPSNNFENKLKAFLK